MGNRLYSYGEALTLEKHSPFANVCAIAGREWNAHFLPGCSPNIWDHSPDQLSTTSMKLPGHAP